MRNSTATLPSHLFKIRYGRSDDLLADFYLPALERAVRYDRLLGYASSTTLAGAAAGLSRLIRRGGSVRLLCCVRLTEDEHAALGRDAALAAVTAEALLRGLGEPEDATVRQRLAALAWMLDHQHLAIRLILPRDAEGLPLRAEEARAFSYQAQEAVVRDAEGHQLAWSGDAGSFWTFASWDRGVGAGRIAAAPSHVLAVERHFESLWEGREAAWDVVELPGPVRAWLLAFCPEQAPHRDPLEKATEPLLKRPVQALNGTVDERLLFRFLREAPFLPAARDLGVATSAVEPWPHQLRVVRRLVERFPESFLLCDEVGLGKTVEAGLALRQLIVSGCVRRALLLVPANVLRQWQEELYEKVALDVPRLADGALYGVAGHKLAPRRRESVWNAAPIVLASSQLTRRRERHAELLAAEPWDLVIVDEAHHARRRDFRGGHDHSNRLLELLAGRGSRRGLRDRTRCLYLLTATPMQVHPVEIWDLLKLLGLGGRWGAGEENFLRFFSELRRPFRDRDWPFLLGLLADHLETAGQPASVRLDSTFRRAVNERFGEEVWSQLESLPAAVDPERAVARLEPPARQALDELLRRHTPLGTFVERNTRQLLRRYRMQGLLDANVPERRPENVWISLRDDERALYERIETYLSDFYRQYERQRRGLGFVMTVYRRRLTSSFYAIRRSLERRLATLGGDDATAGLVEDFELQDLERELPGIAVVSDDRRYGEREHLENFLSALGALGRDSKVERLLSDLEMLLAERETALVFTQYTDTMDHLREELRSIYGPRVACYSGRGGERWRDATWVPCPKEQIKEAFRHGEIRVLLASDSASEGLNLQTCGTLINFDMPWNPMRVEQRIGRIDRIGQAFRTVWIKNYFYADTVEAVIYQRLSDRIRWFEEVLGKLQPILHQVSEAIESVAMLGGRRRSRCLEERMTLLGQELEQLDGAGLSLDDTAGHADLGEPEKALATPVTLRQLEAVLVGSEALGPCFTPDPAIAQVYKLAWKGEERLVTFSPEVFDRYPNSVELLTYGYSLFDELLGSTGEGTESPEPCGLGLYRTRNPQPLSLFLHPVAGETVAVTCLEDLDAALAAPAGAWSGSAESRAAARFSEARQRRLRRLDRAARRHRRAQARALAEAARRVLQRAALLTLAASPSPSLFEETLPYGFGREAVEALGQRGAPFGGLLDIVAGEDVEARSDDPFLRQIRGRPPKELRRKNRALAAEGREIVARHAILTAPAVASPEPGGILERTWFPLIEAAQTMAQDEPPFRVLELAEVRPFENALPLYDQLESIAGRFVDGPTGDDLQTDELRAPADFTWVEPRGRTVPAAGLFVARVTGEAMNRRVVSGSWCVFRLAPPNPRDGQLVLARHRDVRDPETGGQVTLRIYENAAETSDDGSWRPRVVLRPASTDPVFRRVVLNEPEEGGFRVLALLVEVLG